MSSNDLSIDILRTPGLGDSTYVVTYEQQGILVDPQRDVDRFLDVFARNNVEPRWVLETHLHNDYVSGGVLAAERSGAELVLPAAAAPAYQHTPAFHMEDLGGDGLTIRPIHTPGHTPEHTSYLILIDNEPVAVFSGGSLLVGSAGRTDLLGQPRAESLARLQYQSLHRLAALPEDVGLYPTHGAGSFCSASGATNVTSTIREERASSPVLNYESEDAFVTGQLAGLQPYPSYYQHMGPANTLGYPSWDSVLPEELSWNEARAEYPDAVVIDARPVEDFAAGHIPGTLSVELRDDFGTWVGWLIEIDSPVVLILNPGQDADEAAVQLARIGMDNLKAFVRDISEFDGNLQTFELVGVEEYADAARRGEQLLDVRGPAEWDDGHVPDSIYRYVPDLAVGDFQGLDPDKRLWVGCGTGFRAGIAAKFLQDAGFDIVILRKQGIPEVLTALGTPIEADA